MRISTLYPISWWQREGRRIVAPLLTPHIRSGIRPRHHCHGLRTEARGRQAAPALPLHHHNTDLRYIRITFRLLIHLSHESLTAHLSIWSHMRTHAMELVADHNTESRLMPFPTEASGQVSLFTTGGNLHKDEMCRKEIIWLPMVSGSRHGKEFLMAVGRRPALPIHPVAWNLGSAYHFPLNRPPASIRQDGVIFSVHSSSRAAPFPRPCGPSNVIFNGPNAI